MFSHVTPSPGGTIPSNTEAGCQLRPADGFLMSANERMKRSSPFRKSLPLILAACLFNLVPAPDLFAAGDEDVMTKEPLAAKSSNGTPVLFEKLEADRTGISMEYPIDSEHPLRRLQAYGWATGGVAIGDVNNDGKADLFFAGTSVPNRLYIQVEDFQFLDVTARAGVAAPESWCAGAAFADIDNDEDLDLYVTTYRGPNLLYVNESGRSGIKFTEKGKSNGLALSDGFLNAAFCDYDRDGDLDVYLQAYHLEPEQGRPEQELPITIREGIPLLPPGWVDHYVVQPLGDGKFTWREAGRPDYLMQNDGFGNFTDVSGDAGIALGRAYGVSATWWDADHNGWPDLYVANDGHDPDLFYRNTGGKFSQLARPVFSRTPWFTRGTVAADFNNDLKIDLFSADSGPASHAEMLGSGFPSPIDATLMLQSGGNLQVRHNALMLNAGAARFVDVSRMAGIDRTGASWSAQAADFDNDGRVDLFLANGATRDWLQAAPGSLESRNLVGKTRWDLLADFPERKESDAVFRNLGELRFEDAAEAWGLAGETMSYASGCGDLDGDGDLDLVVCRAGEPVGIYRNHSSGNRIVLRLLGRKTNTWGIGAEALIDVGGKTQMRQLLPGGGFLSAKQPEIFFGIGRAAKVDKLTIHWPTGAVETLTDLEANHRYAIIEAMSNVTPVDRGGRVTPMFAREKILPDTGYVEAASNPKTVQKMAPRWLSRLGPAQAWSDLDGDGRAEVFLGGSRDRRGQIVTRSPALAGVMQPFTLDAPSEDAGAVFFDADNDDDLDLYVASGGIESPAGDPLYRDRLYINRNGKLTRKVGNHLPNLADSGGTVAAADFDRDGDVDLFVAGRVAVGDYPKPPKNRLLINDGGGNFSEAPAATAPGLADSGMTGGALWSDIDNDGWLDLLTAHDWGPIRVWKNTEGKLADATAKAGTGNLLGRWQGLTGGDIDNDGDIDYLASNQGLNSDLPDKLVFGELGDQPGNLLLEIVREDNRELPLRDFGVWKSVVPELGGRFKNGREFAAAGIPNLFNPEKLAKAFAVSINTRETGLLINDGTGKLSFRPLPRIAQIAPAFGAVMTDANYDGLTDVYLVHNLDTARTSSEPKGDGLSQLLLGTGDPARPLEPVSPDQSGLIVGGEARSVAVVDSNDDDRADFSVGVNGGDPAVFLNRFISGQVQPLTISLSRKGKHAAGARVTVKCDGMPEQTAEYYAGGGHFSQSPSILFFGAPAKPQGPALATIRWSDGETTRRKIYFD